MPGSAGTGGSQAPQATSTRSDTDPRNGLGMAGSSPGIMGTLPEGLGDEDGRPEVGSPAQINERKRPLPVACSTQNRTGGFPWALYHMIPILTGVRRHRLFLSQPFLI